MDSDFLDFIMPPIVGAIFGIILLVVVLIGYSFYTWTIDIPTLWHMIKELYLWFIVGFALCFWGFFSNNY